MKKKIMPILAVVLLVTMMPMTVMAAVPHCGVAGAGNVDSTITFTNNYSHFYGILKNKTCNVAETHKVTYYSCIVCGSHWYTDEITATTHSACGQ